MKKFIALSLALAMTAVPAFADESVSVSVNGKQISFGEQPPVVKDNTVLLPLRNIAEEMGAEILWHEDTKCATILKDIEGISFTVGKAFADADNYKEIKLDKAPELINNRIMVSADSIAQAFDASVEWDKTNNSLIITDGRRVTSVDTAEISNEVKADDGSVIYSVDYKYPVLNDSVKAPGKDAANAVIKQFFTDTCAKAEADVKSAAIELNEFFKDSESRPHIEPSVFGGFKVTYISDSIVSLYTDISTETGGAHPMTYRYGLTIDLNTGKRLSLSDIAEGDTSKLIKETYTAAIQNDSDQRFFPDTAQRIDEIVPGVDFYIEDGHIVLFAQLYEVAPYAAGFVTIPVPAAKIKL